MRRPMGWRGHEAAQMQLPHAAQRLAAEQEYGVKLAAAAAEKQHWYDLSQRQSKELAEAQAELEKSRNTLQEQTRAAVDKDGSSFNGKWTSSDEQGSVTGGFYGDKAAEMAGRYSYHDKKDERNNAFGVFGGKKQ